MTNGVVRGATIRARREALELTLEQVARSTRIPLAHLRALEAERLQEIPAGPYHAAYTRAVCEHLGLDPGESDEPTPLPATPPQGAPLWVVRGMAIGSVVALSLLLGSLGLERIRTALPALSDLPLATGSPQRLEIVARRKTTLAVWVDDAPALDRVVEEGETLTFTGKDAVEIAVRAVSHVKISWNGVAVVPQGRVDAPRKLRFEDDGGVPW